MPEIPIKPIQGEVSLRELCNEFAKIQKDLRYLLNGQIDFENIRARAIKADNIEAGAITANEIKAGAVTADKIDVDELSAITANLGHITAGLIESIEIFGSYIATANGTFPRVELSNTLNMLIALRSATDFIALVSGLTTPSIMLDNGNIISSIFNYSLGGDFLAIDSDGDIVISSDHKITVSSSEGSIADLVKAINDLTAALSGKADTFTGATDVVSVVTSVDFMAQTTTSKTVAVGNGIVEHII